jgi:hypothetical protein
LLYEELAKQRMGQWCGNYCVIAEVLCLLLRVLSVLDIETDATDAGLIKIKLMACQRLRYTIAGAQ